MTHVAWQRATLFRLYGHVSACVCKLMGFFPFLFPNAPAFASTATFPPLASSDYFRSALLCVCLN